ncbi:MAG: sigma-70 family RNA polymerase sigma factor [Planctomycetes bacterium]|nr:sigma-70 family RNA polymerase sigma factor [Planctomycetota bacterium]
MNQALITKMPGHRREILHVRPVYDLRSLIDIIHGSPLDQSEVQEQIQMLRDLLTDLPDRQRQALELTVIKGLSMKEASEKMGCSHKTIRSYRCRGLAQLKVWLHKDNE